MSGRAEDLQALETRLGLAFSDRRLLRSALTHRSYLNETLDRDSEDNERLEFLGDALLDFIAGEMLYVELPEAPEGELTAARAAIVCETGLAGLAEKVGLGAYVRLGRGEESSGGRERASMLCDVFEAVVGAMYLEGGVEPVRRFLTPLFQAELRPILEGRSLKDSKSRLQELAQSKWQITPEYTTVSEEGPDHAKEFVVEARVGETVWGSGKGSSKSAAARRAALEALERIDSHSGAKDEATTR